MTAAAVSASAAASAADPRADTAAFFNLPLNDEIVARAIQDEQTRQADGIELIASENLVSRAVLEAQGSILTNKYAEGYPNARYYSGCEHIDTIEALGVARARELFNCAYANLQPHCGASANQAAFLALLKPGDTFLGQSLSEGGHLTHGSPVNLSGKWFNAVSYGLDSRGYIDYDAVAALAREHKPALLLAGASAYPRVIDFARLREIADSAGAWFMVDMAHIAGLVAADAHPSPLPHAHVVTTTTHKTLRGARGGMLLTNDEKVGKKLASAVFPGLQGGPLEHAVAGKTVALGEALKPEFKDYIGAVVENAKTLARALVENGYSLVSGGTDNHMLLVDLRDKNLTGAAAADCLERAGMTCNKNAVPDDPEPPRVTSGIRLGTPAATTRGFRAAEFAWVGATIARLLDALAAGDASAQEREIKNEVRALCRRFPIYS
ncbi:MAG: serine hydroxymethyltransferase [Alphaproteobacteria bacterium]|nr:serine hydroxymethyltransferase [Alphaproteobacteria bacterium]MDA7983289.1 serine hydroxymethyltransferase [Alphaproteobacteria bacterium]MDA7989020.1 serine hydroxymethyltransferase [Alphaproteobacteria bacterium]